MKNPKTLRSLFTLLGFVASANLAGVFGDRYARVIKLRRRKKRPAARAVDTGTEGITTSGFAEFVISRWSDGESTWNSNDGVSTVQGAVACM